MMKKMKHHIHVKCGDEFLVISHDDNCVIEISELFDVLVDFLTKGNEK